MNWSSRLATRRASGTVVDAFLVGAAAFLAYWPIQYAWFTGHDDWFIVRVAEDIVANMGLVDQLQFLVEPAQGNYVRNLGFLVASWVWRISPMNPGLLHMANVAIHAMSALAVLRLGWLLCGTRWTGIVAGVLFAIAPASFAPVIRIHGIYDMVCTCLYLWALVASLSWIRSRSMTHLACAVFLHVLALFANEKGISLPGLVWILHVADRRKWEPRAWLVTLLPFIAVTGAYIGLRLHIFEGQPVESLWSPPRDRSRDPFTLLTAIRLIPEVLLVRIPAGFVAVPSLSPEKYAPIGSGLLAMMFASSALLHRKINRSALLFATGGCIMLIIPILNASHGIDFYHHLNFSYLPSALFCIWIGTLAETLSPANRPGSVPLVVLALGVLLLVPEARLKCAEVIEHGSRDRTFAKALEQRLDEEVDPVTICLLDDWEDASLATYLFSEQLARRTPHRFIYGAPGKPEFCVYNNPREHWSRYRRGEPWRRVELDLRDSFGHLPFRLFEVTQDGSLVDKTKSVPGSRFLSATAVDTVDLLEYADSWSDGQGRLKSGSGTGIAFSVTPPSASTASPPSGDTHWTVHGPVPVIADPRRYEIFEVTYRATIDPPSLGQVEWGNRVGPDEQWNPLHYYGLVPKMPSVRISWSPTTENASNLDHAVTMPFIPDGRERRLMVYTRNLPAWWRGKAIEELGLEFRQPSGGRWNRQLEVDIPAMRLIGSKDLSTGKPSQENDNDNTNTQIF